MGGAMPDADDSLTLEGLARILRDHAGAAASSFAQLREQDARLQAHQREQDERFRAELRAQDERYHAEQREQDTRFQARMDELHREIGAVASMVRDLAQLSVREMDAREEDRQHIRQIFARMEEYDLRFEAVNLEIREMRTDIRRILNAIERRGGNGGSRPETQQP